MKIKFKIGDWVRIKTGKLKGIVATIDQVLTMPSLDHALYVLRWPDVKNIERSYLCAKNQYISKQLESTEKRANEGDNVYITTDSLYGCGAIITKIQCKFIYGTYSDVPTSYKYMYTLRYVDPKTKESTTGEFEPWQFSHKKPIESKKPITFHTDECPDHTVVNESGAISFVRDCLELNNTKSKHNIKTVNPDELRKLAHGEQKPSKQEPSKQMVDYNKKDVENIVTVRRRIAWNEICTQYVEEFCRRHGYTLEYNAWVGGDIGTTICINDMYIRMDEIRYDVDNDIPVEKFAEWYWKSLDVFELTGEKWLNYTSFCNGAPDHWPDERLNKIRESRKKIDELKKDLDEEIKRYQMNFVCGRPVGGF